VALLRFDNAYMGTRRSADLQIIDDALALITDPVWRDELGNLRFLATAMFSAPRETMETAATTPDSVSRAAILAAEILMGRFDEVIEELTPPADTRAIPAPDEPWHHWLLFGHRAIALAHSGRLGEADELLTMAYHELMDHPAAEARAFVAAWMAILHLEQGRPVSAFRRASESYSLFEQLGRSSVAPRPYVAAAHALAMTGRAEQAAATLTALDALAVPILPFIRTELLQARAWVAAAAGDLPTARARLDESAAFGEEIGDLVDAARALHGLARLGQARQVAARLDELATQVDGEFVVARAAYANAVADGDREALREVSQAFEGLGATLYAAVEGRGPFYEKVPTVTEWDSDDEQ